MKLFLNIIFIVFLSIPINAQNIATIRISYILENSNNFNNFLSELEKKKSIFLEQITIEEKNLALKKKEIEESKILLNEYEFDKLVNNFNNEAEIYQKKIAEFDRFIQNNLENNEKLMINSIFNIIQKISLEKKFDLVINEDQYFLASDKIDISDMIINQINKQNLNLEIKPFK